VLINRPRHLDLSADLATCYWLLRPTRKPSLRRLPTCSESLRKFLFRQKYPSKTCSSLSVDEHGRWHTKHVSSWQN